MVGAAARRRRRSGRCATWGRTVAVAADGRAAARGGSGRAAGRRPLRATRRTTTSG